MRQVAAGAFKCLGKLATIREPSRRIHIHTSLGRRVVPAHGTRQRSQRRVSGFSGPTRHGSRTHNLHRALYKTAPTTPPMVGPTIGIQAYPQSEVPFPGIGSSACAIRGPRSRAGLIAYPVGPPNERPIDATI